MSRPPAFEDHFSSLARQYAAHRPHYPAALFEFLAHTAAVRRLVWDVGTGNGQAARALAEHFERVYAADASAEQLACAEPHPRVTYVTEPAERTSLPNAANGAGVDLVTVAQAVHWFDLDSFYAEVRRVASRGCVIAVWTYKGAMIDPAIDRVMERFYFEILGRYWSPRVKLADDQYRDLPFPFAELSAPEFFAEAHWTLDGLWGYLSTMSALKTYVATNHTDPRDQIRDELSAAWGDPQIRRTIRWRLAIRVGRVGT